MSRFSAAVGGTQASESGNQTSHPGSGSNTFHSASLGLHSAITMLDWRLASAHFILTVTLMLWSSGKVLSADVATEVFDLRVTDVQSPPTAREEKSATDLAAKFLLLDEFVSLENDVIETKKKRSFSGFGSPLDRLSAGSVEHKGKQRKVVDHPKRRFGIPVDRIGGNRLSNSRG